MDEEQKTKDLYNKKLDLYKKKQYLLAEKKTEIQKQTNENGQEHKQENGRALVLKKPTSNNSSSGFVNVLILTLLVGFISGITFMLAYNFIK